MLFVNFIFYVSKWTMLKAFSNFKILIDSRLDHLGYIPVDTQSQPTDITMHLEISHQLLSFFFLIKYNFIFQL